MTYARKRSCFFGDSIFQKYLCKRFFRIADISAQLLSLSGYCLAFRIAHELPPAGLEELLGPFAIQALSDPFVSTQLGD